MSGSEPRIAENNTQFTASTFKFDFAVSPTREKLPSRRSTRNGDVRQRTIRAPELKPLPTVGRLAKEEPAGPFELPAIEISTKDESGAGGEECSSSGTTSNVDSGYEGDSITYSSNRSEDSHAPECTDVSPQYQSPPRASLFPPWKDGSKQALSAYTSLQRVLDPSRSQIPGKPMMNILGRETFLEVLDNPPAKYRLQQYTSASLSPKYMAFLDQVRYYRKVIKDSGSAMIELDELYLDPAARTHIDLSGPAITDLRGDVGLVLRETFPSISSMFNDAEHAIQDAIFTEAYPDFVRQQMALSATKALTEDRHRFKGLGDCFCLTQPSKADNPIMFASDGFVSVTGYERSEIIPRNCRFLQGRETDTSAVQRIRHYVKTEQESVEFLLNYRKNGEPFWNLLYTAPLLDAKGRTVFYIGGQVNCSSSIHGSPDIMRILATLSEDESEERPRSPRSDQKKGRETPASELARRFEHLKALRYRQAAQVAEEPGIERELLEANQDRPLPDRIERFYNAYSKYLVVLYPRMTVEFSSPGIYEILNVNDKQPSTSNVYKFLRESMLHREKSDWTSRVKSALKRGKPISVALNLQTRRSAVFRGDESFLTHWTPLKDVQGTTQWVVVCLGLVSGQ